MKIAILHRKTYGVVEMTSFIICETRIRLVETTCMPHQRGLQISLQLNNKNDQIFDINREPYLQSIICYPKGIYE